MTTSPSTSAATTPVCVPSDSTSPDNENNPDPSSSSDSDSDEDNRYDDSIETGSDMYSDYTQPPPPEKAALDRSRHLVSDDIGLYSSTHSFSAGTKFSLLSSHLQPPPDFKFPQGSRGCSFKHRWLHAFPWLVYSKQQKDGYFLPCVLFTTSDYHGSAPGILVSYPLTTFGKDLETLRKYVSKEH